MKLRKFTRELWDDELLELIYAIESSRGAINSPALGEETIKSIQYWVKIENSIRSNRIENNQTTYAELENALKRGKLPTDELNRYRVLETTNHYDAEQAIDATYAAEADNVVSEALIRESHRLLLDQIPERAGGVPVPGEYRKSNVTISGSSHKPPDSLDVPILMSELVDFSRRTKRVDFLIDAAIAHHRFTWIHPFKNGNGRAARLFTYAMLKFGGFHFNGMISLPRAFEREKQTYYDHLSLADAGNIEAWIKYFLKTLKSELGFWEVRLGGRKLEESIDKFLGGLLKGKEITKNEMRALKIAFLFGSVTNERFRAETGVSRPTATRTLSSLVRKGYLESIGIRKGYRLASSAGTPLVEFFMPDANPAAPRNRP